MAALAYSVAFTSLYGLNRRANVEGAYGQAMLADGRNAEALAALKTAVRLRPDGAELHFMLGVALSRTGSFDAGCEQVIEAVRLDHDNGDGFVGIYASELVQAAPPEQVLEPLQRLARATPDSAIVHNFIGHALVARGRADEAIRSFETAVRLDPKLADAHCRLGLLLARTGQIDRAITLLQEAVRLDPGQIDAHVALSQIFSAIGRPDEAQAHREAALRLQSGVEPGRGPTTSGR